MKNKFELFSGFIILIFIGYVFMRVVTTPPVPEPVVPQPVPSPSESATTPSAAFMFEVEEAARIEIGAPIEGYEPAMLMQVFPGFVAADFNEVDAVIGNYFYDASHDEVRYVAPMNEPMHSAGPSISEAGFDRLFQNVTERFLSYYPNGDLELLMEWLKDAEYGVLPQPPLLEPEPVTPPVVACTMDAKMCPDGSFVGRVGPNCEFAACPEPVNDEVTYCPDRPKGEEIACIDLYAPVCGQVQVECITTPCDPVSETFSNSCYACANDRVVSYTEGACDDASDQ